MGKVLSSQSSKSFTPPHRQVIVDSGSERDADSDYEKLSTDHDIGSDDDDQEFRTHIDQLDDEIVHLDEEMDKLLDERKSLDVKRSMANERISSIDIQLPSLKEKLDAQTDSNWYVVEDKNASTAHGNATARLETLKKQVKEAETDVQSKWDTAVRAKERLEEEERLPKDWNACRIHFLEKEIKYAQAEKKLAEQCISQQMAKIEGFDRKIELSDEIIKGIWKRMKEAHAVLPAAVGPKCLSFLDGDIFMVGAAIVIIANIVVLTLEMTHSHGAATSEYFYRADITFLVIYIVELFLKAIYYQKALLIGPIWKVWWNWLDLLIVVTGVLDACISATGGSSGTWMNYIRVLRLARLARILKIVRIFVQSDFSWTEGEFFQGFIMSVIAFNAILLGAEVNYPDLSIWWYIEQGLLGIFSFELLVRIKAQGCEFFYKDWVWNWLDFTIVVGGVIDQWALPMVEFIVKACGGSSVENTGGMAQVMMLLRLARLLRILRLVRLIKKVKPLYNLFYGIIKSIQGMVWVVVLTFVVLYMCALLGCKLIGQGLLFGGREFLPGELADNSNFSSIFDAMWTWFLVMNADTSPVEDLLNIKFFDVKIFRFVVMVYMIFTNWAIFSILTAVVSDNMAKVTEQHEQDEVDADKAADESEREIALNELFEKVDVGKDGNLTKDDWEKMAHSGDWEKLQDITKKDEHELNDLFQILAVSVELLPRAFKPLNTGGELGFEFSPTGQVTKVADTGQHWQTRYYDGESFRHAGVTTEMLIAKVDGVEFSSERLQSRIMGNRPFTITLLVDAIAKEAFCDVLKKDHREPSERAMHNTRRLETRIATMEHKLHKQMERLEDKIQCAVRPTR